MLTHVASGLQASTPVVHSFISVDIDSEVIICSSGVGGCR